MVAHVGLLLEHLAARQAFVAALHLVGKALMARQLGLLGKGLATHLALKLVGLFLLGAAALNGGAAAAHRTNEGQRDNFLLFFGLLWGLRGLFLEGLVLGRRGRQFVDLCRIGTVGAPMIEKLGHVDESLATGAVVQGVWRMGAPMGQQHRLGAKAQATFHAEEARLATVLLPMFLESSWRRQHLATQRTFEGTLPVAPHVQL